jgi:hypothetical protein
MPHLRRPEYLMQITAAKTTHYLDWETVAMRHHRKSIGLLTVDLRYNVATGEWDWDLTHANGTVLYRGGSETVSLAQLEALAYAENWVKGQETLVNA